MIEEDYVSYDVAKLLKEKGFDERTIYHYIIGQPTSLQHNIVYNKYCNSDAENIYVSPTHQMAMKWLREVYNIFIEIIIFRENMVHYRFKILNRDCEKIYIDDGSQFSYEEAVEAALKYSLESLI